MREHTVSSFDQDLRQIDQLIREMSDLAAAMVSASIDALLEADEATAQQVIADDKLMDAKQREVDDRAITLIAKRQPMAQDLRAVIGAIRMAGDLERVGDLAKNVAKRVGAIGKITAPRALSTGIKEMADLVLGQIRNIVAAYADRKPQELQTLRIDDEKIDVKYTSIFRELLTYMMEDPRNITPCTHLLFCAKNLERIGDHMTNIAENAYYVLTGTQLPLQRPKLDEMSSSISE
ncbi:phosphate signaling complex protein PhoU [Pseudaminobacter sp. 19-2017]|uniref:Phosphate-specific transport system accessory protein PhoU n=1 Tax=Pseudaminobacter soli (ex Zhang et al. 2022) TaxID=2831468 RepID=A0A942I2N8_9HYPH|nr:phosphate signaling complex protein PhoU [Pseudaminobacter soli]MBS3649982.1 phosphate signaling complex protein PhoU [Pseudaminobacter soli]